MPDDKSRYAGLESFHVSDRNGRTVAALPPAPPAAELTLGFHLRKEADRLDHLAARYLKDPAGFWRIAGHNAALLPDALTELLEIAIPGGKN